MANVETTEGLLIEYLENDGAVLLGIPFLEMGTVNDPPADGYVLYRIVENGSQEIAAGNRPIRIETRTLNCRVFMPSLDADMGRVALTQKVDLLKQHIDRVQLGSIPAGGVVFFRNPPGNLGGGDAGVDSTFRTRDLATTFETESHDTERGCVGSLNTIRLTFGSDPGLAVGDLIGPSASGWVKAQALSGSTQATRIVTRKWSALQYDATGTGSVATVTAHGFGAAGTDVYLSQSTAGATETPKPSTGYAQRVAVVVGTDELELVFSETEDLGT